MLEAETAARYVYTNAACRPRVLTHGGRELGEISETLVPGAGRLAFVYLTDPEGNVLEIQKWSRPDPGSEP